MEPGDSTLTDAVKIALQVEYAHTLLVQHRQHTELTSQVPSSTDNSPIDDSLSVQQISRQRPPRAPDTIVAIVDLITMNQGHHGASPWAGLEDCSGLNHFAKVCLSAPTNVSQQHSLPQPVSGCTEISNICSKQVSFKTCTVQLGEVSVPLILDTVAAASLHKLVIFPHTTRSSIHTGVCKFYH